MNTMLDQKLQDAIKEGKVVLKKFFDYRYISPSNIERILQLLNEGWVFYSYDQEEAFKRNKENYLSTKKEVTKEVQLLELDLDYVPKEEKCDSLVVKVLFENTDYYLTFSDSIKISTDKKDYDIYWKPNTNYKKDYIFIIVSVCGNFYTRFVWDGKLKPSKIGYASWNNLLEYRKYQILENDLKLTSILYVIDKENFFTLKN